MRPLISTYYSFDHDAAGAVGELVGESIAGSNKSPDLTLLILPRRFAGQGDLCMKTIEKLVSPKNILGFAVDSLPGMTSTVPQPPVSLVLNVTEAPISIIDEPMEESGLESHWTESLITERARHPGINPTGILFSFSEHHLDQFFIDLWNHIFPGSQLILIGAKGNRKTNWGRLGVRDSKQTSVLVLFWEIAPLKFEPLSPTSQCVVPLGIPMVVTKVEGKRLLEIAGRPAALQLMKAATQCMGELAVPDEIPQLSNIALGIPQNPYLFDYGPGEFDICSIADIDLESESITMADELTLGSAVQFMKYTSTKSACDTELLKRQGIVFSKTQKRDQTALSNEAIAPVTPTNFDEGLFRILVDRILVQHQGSSEAISTSAAAVCQSQDVTTKL